MAAISLESPSGHEKEQRGLVKILILPSQRTPNKKILFDNGGLGDAEVGESFASDLARICHRG
jgi:hypothetical protein